MTPPKINTADGKFVKFCRKSDKFGYTYSFFPVSGTSPLKRRQICRGGASVAGKGTCPGIIHPKAERPENRTLREQACPKTGLPLPDGRTVRIKGATLKDEAKAEVKRNITENKRKSTEAYEKRSTSSTSFRSRSKARVASTTNSSRNTTSSGGCATKTIRACWWD